MAGDLLRDVRFERFGGSWAFWVEPPGYEQGRPVTLCVACHGAGGYVRQGEADWIRPNAGGRATLERLLECGLLVGMSDAASDAWGNADAQADTAAFIQGLQGRYPLGPQILLVGRSMGGPLALNLTLGALAGQVARLALLQPVTDLVGRRAGASVELRRAFGFTAAEGDPAVIADADWRAAVEPFCPLTQVRRLVDGGTAAPSLPPLHAWHNRSDTVCPIARTEALVSLWRRLGTTADLTALDGDGHTVYGQEPVASAVAGFVAGCEEGRLSSTPGSL